MKTEDLKTLTQLVKIREEQKIVELAADLKIEGYTFKNLLPILKETFPNMKTTTQDLKVLRANIKEELS